ncbi:MAG: orotate phosphoribosyltransferase [Methanobacterium sp.]|nr:orotate phosphoribosyltransferase [Methanobacterium sp.]
MEVTGICASCGRTGKMYTCSLCGGSFCINCYLPQKRICKSCKSGLKFEK